MKLNGKEGFIDRTGKIVIPLKYNKVSRFIEGLSAVDLNGKWGHIDKSGKIIIPLKYHLVVDFDNGYAGVSFKDSEHFYINKNDQKLE